MLILNDIVFTDNMTMDLNFKYKLNIIAFSATEGHWNKL